MIYFVQPIDGGPIKIGHSEDISRRLPQLESHYGCALALLATMDGGQDQERLIHERFEHLRFGRTEQFRPARDLMEFIRRPLLVHAAPDAVEVMEGRTHTVTLKGSEQWKQWLERSAKHCRVSISSLIDLAVTEYVKAMGFKEEPPER